MSLRPVLLFKEPTPDDIYEKTLETKGYSAKCVPVLHTSPTNIDILVEHLRNAQQLGLQGAIVTSKRSCESLSDAFTRICSSSEGIPLPALEYWSTIPFYVVGGATASAIREIQQRFQDYGFTFVQTLGELSGTGEQLGHFIVQRCATLAPLPGKLLYLTGDKNRDTVASILSANQIPFLPLQVYETRKRPDFEQLLEDAVNALQVESPESPWWMVYYAPSTAAFAMPATRRLLASRNVSSRTATIGPVTTSFIEKDPALVVHATASKPDASNLTEAIIAYDSVHRDKPTG